MPKVASYRLSWSFTDQAYQLQETHTHTQLQIRPESPAWFAWLDQVSSFAFRGKGGHYTARKENRPRGEAYWYAYAGAGKKLAKKYLGKTTDVTLARLEQVARTLADQEPAAGREFPTGTTTLLFTDIEGSTRLLQQLGKGYAEVLTACRQLLRAVFKQHQGYEVDTQGDAFFVVFARATDAVTAAVSAQRVLTNHVWPEGVVISVRMGLHTGEPQLHSEGYVGLDTHLAARIMSVGHGGQVLLSQTTRELVEYVLPEGVSLRDLGEHRLKDLPHSVHLYQLVIEGVAADFPPLKTAESNKQGDPLLATRLHVPRLRARLVPRSHLLERLQRVKECAFTLVSAPAGFGKTTLLAQWLAETDTPVAWLSLEPEDNDPVRFLTYLIAALQTVDAQVGTVALVLLHTPQPPPPETVVTLLINELLRSSVKEFVLVFDDYHMITAEPLHRALTALVEHMPPQLHLVLATRADPPLPLSRLRVRGQLLEVRASDLRFSSEEASAFLRTIMGLDLPPGDIEALERRTEGWIAGLQLAALSLQGRADVSGFLAAFTGSHRFVLDYLSEEVLARQPPVVQSFLLRTSVLERLSAPLCDVVTEREGSQAMLEALERANLFVIPLDDERRWYRYHHLFVEVLSNRLQQSEPGRIPELHQRASAWFEQHDLISEAVQHALAAHDFERAARLIEPIAPLLGLSGQLYTVLGWLNMLPDALVRTHPFLCLFHAAMLISANQLEGAEARLRMAEQGIHEREMPAEQAQIIRGHVFALRANVVLFSGDITYAGSLADQALNLLPDTEMLARPSALLTAAHAYFVSGNVTAVTERMVVVADASTRGSDDLIAAVRGATLLARLRMLQGKLGEAAMIYEQAVRVVPRPEMLQALGVSSLFYTFGLGELHYERNSLKEASHFLGQGMGMIRETLTVEPYVAMLGYTVLARLQQALGNFSGTLATLDAFTALAHQRHFALHWRVQMAALRAQLQLAQGDLASAIHWADASGHSVHDDDLNYPREREYLTFIRVRIAQGLENPTGPYLHDALFLLDRLLADAEAKARMRSVLEMLILRVMALRAQDKRAEALMVLQRALGQAAPEGYIRLFVDEGTPMRLLLQEAQAHGIVPEYVATLLTAFGASVSSAPAPLPNRGSLIEPLTEREREVLGLLMEGASNREIARRLVLSINTVKRHIYNICGKLGVQSRTQALVKARTLDLF